MNWFNPNPDCGCCDGCSCDLLYTTCRLHWWCTEAFAARIRDVDTDTIVSTVLHGIIYKPVIGHTYRLELQCENGGVWTNGPEELIPSYTESTCNCCTESKPDYLVASGFTGCCTELNGTWADLVDSGSCNYVQTKTLTVSSTPCATGYCFTNSLTLAGITDPYFWHVTQASVRVIMPTTGTSPIRAELDISLDGYRLRAGVCSFQFFPGVGYVYEGACDISGAITNTVIDDEINIFGNPPFAICGGTAGTVSLYTVAL